jgi:hypothetical protein
MTASCEKVPFGHRSSLIWFPFLAVVAFFLEKIDRTSSSLPTFWWSISCSSVNKEVAKVQMKETLNKSVCVFNVGVYVGVVQV